MTEPLARRPDRGTLPTRLMGITRLNANLTQVEMPTAPGCGPAASRATPRRAVHRLRLRVAAGPEETGR